jgi:hypothetical protein
VKKWLLSKIVTPSRVRRLVAAALSWLIYWCMARGAWDAVSAATAWIRRLADFIDSWNATSLPEEKDRLVADLVARAVTDEAVDRLVERVAAMKAEQCTIAVVVTEEGNAPVQE